MDAVFLLELLETFEVFNLNIGSTGKCTGLHWVSLGVEGVELSRLRDGVLWDKTYLGYDAGAGP